MKRLLGSVAVLIALGMAGRAEAGFLYWSGAGTWDGTTSNWGNASGGPYNTNAWTSGSDARFEGTAGAVTVSGGIAGVNGMYFDTANYAVNSGTLGFINTTATMTISNSAAATVGSTIFGNPTVGGNKIAKIGAGKLTVTGNVTLAGDVNGNLDAGFSVEGGGELELQNGLKAASTLQSGKSNRDNTVGATTPNNTLTINGPSGATVMGGGLFIGSSTFGGNTVNISRPGTKTTPSYQMIGNGKQMNLGVSSTGNSVSISNGAYILQSGSTGGTNTWTIGTNLGANGNAFSLSGAGSTVEFGSNHALVVGGAGNNNTATINLGGLFITRRFQIGQNGGDNNKLTISGIGSLATSSTAGVGSTNSLFEIGTTVGSNSNSMSILSGGAYNFFGDGTTRNFSVGRAGDDNYLEVSGVGSTLNVGWANAAIPITVGGHATGAGPGTLTQGGSGNHIDVTSGGAVTLSVPLYAMGVNSAINLGNGSGTSLLTVGSAAGYTSGVLLGGTGSVLRLNEGTLVAGVSGLLVSGPGQVLLDGPGYFQNSNALVGNTITNPISGAGSLNKLGIGKLILSGTNSYLGDTVVDLGTLSIAQNVGSGLADTADVWINSAATLDLTFASTDTVRSLYIGGVQMAAGTWGSPGGGAANQDPHFTGPGILNVVVAVPEPSTLGLLAVAVVGLLVRRRMARKR